MGEVCWDDRDVKGEEVAVVKGSEKSVVSDTPPGACSVRNWLSKDSGNHRTVGESGDDILFCSFDGDDGSPLLGEKFCVYDFSGGSRVGKEGGGVVLTIGEKRERREGNGRGVRLGLDGMILELFASTVPVSE